MGQIIDMWAPIVPTPEMLAWVRDHFAREMLGYLRVFHGLPAQETSIAAFADMMRGGIALDQVVKLLDGCGVERTLITGFDEQRSVGVTFVDNALVSAIARRQPDRFIPFAGIDVLSGMAGVRQLERLVREEGFKGLSLRPFMIGLPADDRRYYPLYAKCVELGIPASIHASANWSEVRPSDLGHPRHFDVVACDFPELKLILSHAGYPWVLEAVHVAWKHPHVYLELAAHRPRYIAQSGTGWEPLLKFGSSVIRDKVLFGSGSFLLGRSPSEIIEEFKALPLKPEVLEKWLHLNARALLGL